MKGQSQKAAVAMAAAAALSTGQQEVGRGRNRHDLLLFEGMTTIDNRADRKDMGARGLEGPSFFVRACSRYKERTRFPPFT